jgi:hypothetical protein
VIVRAMEESAVIASKLGISAYRRVEATLDEQ